MMYMKKLNYFFVSLGEKTLNNRIIKSYKQE